MDVIIFGANIIGEYIVQVLHENYDVLVLERDKKKADMIAEKYDVDVISDITMEILDKLPWEKLSYSYAVTDDVKDNVLLSIYAKSRGVDVVLCRLDNESYRDLLERMGIYVVSNINIAQHALLLTHKQLIYRLLDMTNSQVVLEEVEGKRFKNKTVTEIEEKLNARVVAVYRAHEFFIPTQSTQILEEDRFVIARQLI